MKPAKKTSHRCRSCQTNEFCPRFKVTTPAERSGSFQECAKCGVLNFFPQHPESAYPDDYYGEGPAKFTGMVARLRSWSVQTRALHCHRLTETPGNCLDIGCGDGSFLSAMQAHGWTVRGCELPGPAYERALRQLPGCISAGTEFDANLPDASLDLISLWQVFEHLEEPQIALQKICRLLKPGGCLVIAVPNPSSFQARLGREHWLHFDPPRHLFLPSVGQLRTLLESHHFEVKKIRRPWLEFGIIGTIQTLFNRLDFPRDELLDCLRTRWQNVTVLKKFLYLAAVATLAIPATLFASIEALAGAPATFEIYARRKL